MTTKKRPSWPRSVKLLPLPIYGGSIALCNTPEEWERCHETLNLDGSVNGAYGKASYFENENGQAIFLIGIFKPDMGTLVHECGHVALFVCERVGINPFSSNGEPYCYLLGAIFDMFSKIIAERIMLQENVVLTPAS